MCVNPYWAVVHWISWWRSLQSWNKYLGKWAERWETRNGSGQVRREFLQETGCMKGKCRCPEKRKRKQNSRSLLSWQDRKVRSPKMLWVTGLELCSGPSWSRGCCFVRGCMGVFNPNRLVGRDPSCGISRNECGGGEPMALSLPKYISEMTCPFPQPSLLITAFGACQGFFSSVSVVYLFLSQVLSWLLRKIHA